MISLRAEKRIAAYSPTTANDTTTGAPAVSLRTGSCSTPQNTTSIHPRRQSMSAYAHAAPRNAR